KAYQFGRKALAIDPAGPLVNDLAGLHTRWTALVGMKDGTAEGAMQTITARMVNCYDWHPKDIAEALAAKATLEEHLNLDSTRTRSDLAERLSILPETVTVVVKRM